MKEQMYWWEAFEVPIEMNPDKRYDYTRMIRDHSQLASYLTATIPHSISGNGEFTYEEVRLAKFLLYEVFVNKDKIYKDWGNPEPGMMTLQYINHKIKRIVKDKQW